MENRIACGAARPQGLGQVFSLLIFSTLQQFLHDQWIMGGGTKHHFTVSRYYLLVFAAFKSPNRLLAGGAFRFFAGLFAATFAATLALALVLVLAHALAGI